jgi:uncharacterized protein (DUF2235 family)
MTDERKIKNIVLLSDGTGNAASKVWRTNVWRLFQSLDLTNSLQVAIYDDGVGSSSFKPLALLGGAFGWGLKRNVLDLYTFLCRNWDPEQPSARIYAFGFSRGAFTIRVLLGLVANQGLVRNTTEADLRRGAVAAYRTYRKNRFHSLWRIERVFRPLRDIVLRIFRRPYDLSTNLPAPKIRFVGLWDTVAAYGLPIEEMTRGVHQWIWPLELPNRTLGPHVLRACHALALDDERTTFHPVLWSELYESPAKPDDKGIRWTKNERISQVWFSGSHSNVGGGYPDDSLAHVSLTWIMKEAEHCALRFKNAPNTDPDAVLFAKSSADKDGRLYDSRHGLSGYYRYGPRKLAELCDRSASFGVDDAVKIEVPKIHWTAIDRTVNGAHGYAPIGIPRFYAVVMPEGEIHDAKQNKFEPPDMAERRAIIQERIWALVWWRRVVYFATLGASFHLALFPLLYQIVRTHEFATPLRFVSETVRLLGGFLPGFAGWWLDAFAASPGRFLIGLGVVVGLMSIGVVLGSNINGQMLVIWRSILKAQTTPPGAAPSGLVYWLRNNTAYKATHRGLKRSIIPFASALLLVYLGASLVSHLAFDVADAAGAFCREGPPDKLIVLDKGGATTTVKGFEASSMCWGTGIKLEDGRRYLITIKDPVGWEDRRRPVPVSGSEIGEVPTVKARVLLFSGLPLRRVLNRPWFRPIARIGAAGAAEYPLDPDTRPMAPGKGATPQTELVAEIKARRDGELFLYVNDAVIGVPGLVGRFYANNSGTAQVEVTRLSRR